MKITIEGGEAFGHIPPGTYEARVRGGSTHYDSHYSTPSVKLHVWLVVQPGWDAELEVHARTPLQPATKAACPECRGSGMYTCLVTDRESPCSLGCSPRS